MSEAIKQAIKRAIFDTPAEHRQSSDILIHNITQAIAALSAEQPKPVAWMKEHKFHPPTFTTAPDAVDHWASIGEPLIPLYASPLAAPASQPDAAAIRRKALEEAAQVCETHTFGSPVAAHAIRALATQSEPAQQEPDNELRRAVRSMTAMLENREWAEHVSTDPDAINLESAITELVGAANEKATAKQAPAEWIQCNLCGNAFNRTEQPDGHGCAQQAGQPAPAVPEGWRLMPPITEEMHIAAVKVLHRASGLDGLPQRMIDAMINAAPAQEGKQK